MFIARVLAYFSSLRKRKVGHVFCLSVCLCVCTLLLSNSLLGLVFHPEDEAVRSSETSLNFQELQGITSQKSLSICCIVMFSEHRMIIRQYCFHAWYCVKYLLLSLFHDFTFKHCRYSIFMLQFWNRLCQKLGMENWHETTFLVKTLFP
jgi:hypothetical protein